MIIVFFPSPDLLVHVTGQLMWSLFGMTSQSDMVVTDSPVATYVQRGLYFAFLILSVIMMTNILVALLTKTFDNASVRRYNRKQKLKGNIKIGIIIIIIIIIDVVLVLVVGVDITINYYNLFICLFVYLFIYLFSISI